MIDILRELPEEKQFKSEMASAMSGSAEAESYKIWYSFSLWRLFRVSWAFLPEQCQRQRVSDAKRISTDVQTAGGQREFSVTPVETIQDE